VKFRTEPLLAPTLLMLVVSLGGRFTLDRLGLQSLAWLDLRLVGLTVALALVALQMRWSEKSGTTARAHRAEGWLVAGLLFFGFQIASGLWAPLGARVGLFCVDIISMTALTVGFYFLARQAPVLTARRVLWFFWVTGVLFALASLAAGPGVQGRYAAFGGGPNVFVRIQILALIAVVALVAGGARPRLLWSVPLFVVAAVLSGSRGGLLAGFVVGVAVVLRGGWRTRRFALAGILLAATGTAVAYYALPPAHDLIKSRFLDQTAGQGYLSERPEIFSGALSLFRHQPITGAGLDGFYALIGSAVGIEYPHNYLLAVAAEGGMVGLVLLGLTGVLWTVRVRSSRPWGPEISAMVVSAAFIAIASMFSGDYYDARTAWICAAVAAAATTGRRRQAAAPPRALADDGQVAPRRPVPAGDGADPLAQPGRIPSPAGDEPAARRF
jgi:O-antigen ligase